MDALDEPIKKAEQDIDNLKIGMGEVMGANVHGPSGNQLTGSGWFGRMMGLGEQEEEELRAPQIGKPLFAANDTMVHTAEMSGETQPIPTTEPDPSDPTSDFWDTHVRPDPFRPGDPNLNNAPLKPGTPGTETIQTTFPDVTDPTSNFWDTHVRPEPFNPNDPNLINAPLKPGMTEPDYTQYVVESDDGKNTGERRGVTDSGGGYADFFRDQRGEGKKGNTIQGEHLTEKETLDLFDRLGIVSDVVGNVPYRKVLEDIAQMKDLSQVDDAQIINVNSGDGKNDILEIYKSEVLPFEEKADTLMGYYGGVKNVMDMVMGMLDGGSKAVDVLETAKEVMENSGQFTSEDYDKLSAQIITEGRYFKIDMTDTKLRPFGGSDTYYYTVMVELEKDNDFKQPYHAYVYSRNMNTPPVLGSYMNPKQPLPMWYNFYYEYK